MLNASSPTLQLHRSLPRRPLTRLRGQGQPIPEHAQIMSTTMYTARWWFLLINCRLTKTHGQKLKQNALGCELSFIVHHGLDKKSELLLHTLLSTSSILTLGHHKGKTKFVTNQILQFNIQLNILKYFLLYTTV